MTRRSGAALMVGAVLLAGSVAGCGNSQDEYCTAIAAQQSVFADDGTGVALLDHLPELDALAKKAPDDLTDEWQTALAALHGLHDAISAAGIKPTDFVNGKPPASVSAADQHKIATAASQISESGVVDAFNGIDQQAKDVCKLQLGL